MQSFKTCFASQITGVRVGRSAVAVPGTVLPANPPVNTLKDNRAHTDRLAAIEANNDLTQNQKLAAVDKENQDWAATNRTPDNRSYDNSVYTDQSPIELTIVDPVTGKTRNKTNDEIKAEQLTRDKRDGVPVDDQNADGVPDETQDIIHVVLTGGEKRSILRSDITFAPTVLERRQADFPPYAQRQPWNALPDKNGVTGPNSINSSSTVNSAMAGGAANFVEPNGFGTGLYLRADVNDRQNTERNPNQDAYPRVGDWLVEDYDIMTDVYVQKIYDAATFLRYFKASLN